MVLQQAFHRNPAQYLLREAPQEPVFFFDPARLAQTARVFLDGFPGLVTFAVKANPDRAVLEALAAAGLTAFDVASPEEMQMVRAVAPGAALHYHNPIRAASEIAEGQRMGVVSWSVDRLSELDKLGDLSGLEIAVRLKLPVAGAAYDFGSKFGAVPDEAAMLLRRVVERGGTPSVTFHPGTQCRDPQAWVAYIHAAAQVAKAAGVTLHRLNVGGGFPAHREDPAPNLPAIFDAIAQATRAAFAVSPALVCEPGRAMVADCFELALLVKAAPEGAVFLNDGLYGGLGEWRDLGPSPRITALSPEGTPRSGAARPVTVFGPTCDSLDRLSDPVALPDDLSEGDYLLFHACGAYSNALATRFNGYGARQIVTLAR